MKQILWIALGVIAACASINAAPSGGQSQNQGVAAYNKFTKQMYDAISQANADKNVVFSPLSIGMALWMLEVGASGDTKAEITRIQYGNGTQSSGGQFYTSMEKPFKSEEKSESKLSIATGLYHQDGISIKPTYLSTIKLPVAKPVIEECNFRSNGDACRQQINQMVSKNTAQKIPELLKDGFITPRTVAVLVNAVYFKAPWEKKFRVDGITNQPFYRFGRESDQQTVPFLVDKRSLSYVENDKAVTVGIPYKNGDAALCIVLPKAKDGLGALQDELMTSCTGILDADTEEVALQIPKFKVKTSVNLKSVLQSLGASTMFSEAATFDQMTNSKIRISEAAHEAFIDVHENGTEAAAATGMVGEFLSLPPPPKPFVADHPFFYAVVVKGGSRRPNIIAFAGKVLYIEK